MNKNKNKAVVSAEDHYTNLTLVVVAEAMVLLIIQMLIFNSYTSGLVIQTMNVAVPAILIIAGIVAIVSAVVCFVGKKKNASVSLVFGLYVTLLMCVFKYIPNEMSAALSKPICNTLKGQKIGMILSVVYVIAGILYCILAEKRRRKLKNK